MYDLTLIVNLCFPSTYSIDSSLVSFPSTQNAGFLSRFTIEKENLQKQYWQLYLVIHWCSSRKYPYPHHEGNWKFWRGGVKDPGNSRGEGDWTVNLVSKIISNLLSRSFTWKKVAWIYLYLNCIIVEMNFLSSKSTLETTKCENHVVTWKQLPLLVTSIHWSLHVDWKELVTSLVCFCIALGSCQVAVNFFHENDFLY